MRAIVLCAGLGTRLKPVSGFVPKPLMEICGVPLLEIIMRNLKDAGVSRAAVNTHHLADKVSGWIESSEFRDDIEIYHEPEILGTGGPLVSARDFLSGTDKFVLHNGDVLTDADIGAMAARFDGSGLTAMLLLLQGPENKVLVSPDGVVTDILGKTGAPAAPGSRLLTYGCVMMLSPEIFRFLPEKPEFCSIIDALLKAIREKPGSVGGFVPEKLNWTDIGSVNQYHKVHSDILSGKFPAPRGSGRISGQTMLMPGAELSPGASAGGFLFLGRGAKIEAGASLSNCVVLDGFKAKAGDFHSNEILSPDFQVHRERDLFSSLKILRDKNPETLRFSSLAEQGSDRKFIRVKPVSGETFVLMVSSAADHDFDRYISMGAYLDRLGLFTPKIHGFEKAEFTVLMEDLGDNPLYKLAREAKPGFDMLSQYRAVVDCLAEFQARGTASLELGPDSPPVRVFDYDYLRWETSYCRECFLESYCGLDKSETSALDDIFHSLAACVAAAPKTLIHRDFQSQNIIIQNGSPRFVDFQGARLGSGPYDLMSLLKDPYVFVPDNIRLELTERYRELMSRLAPELIQKGGSFMAQTLAAGLQRGMQALGAYGFLSLRKGKTFYLQYIPPALKYLSGTLEDFDRAPGRPFDIAALRKVFDNAADSEPVRRLSAASPRPESDIPVF